MNERELDEKKIIEKALTEEHLSIITKKYNTNYPQPEEIEKIDFTPGTENPAKLTGVIKQLMYDLALERARVWIEQNIKKASDQILSVYLTPKFKQEGININSKNP